MFVQILYVLKRNSFLNKQSKVKSSCNKPNGKFNCVQCSNCLERSNYECYCIIILHIENGTIRLLVFTKFINKFLINKEFLEIEKS